MKHGCMDFIYQPKNQGKLFLGTLLGAKNQFILKKNNIQAILNCAAEANYESDINQKKIDLLDLESENIDQYFQECIEYIDINLKQGKNVFVHCMAGMSRSVSMIVAYLVQKQGFKFQDAIDLIIKVRLRIGINKEFQIQLQNFCQIQQKL